MEMVTTRITDAFPITRPSAVRNVRNLFACSACRLNRRDSPKLCIIRRGARTHACRVETSVDAARTSAYATKLIQDGSLRSRNFSEHFLGEFARRIVRRQIALQVFS